MVWWLVRTEPKRERTAKFNVEQNPSVESYLPCFFDPVTSKIHPLFPSYLFVRCSDGIWGFLKRTIGVSTVILRGGSPDEMSDGELDELKEREYEGLVRLQKFAPGQKIELHGNLGWYGIYHGQRSKDRCRILVSMFGREVPASVDLRQVRPV